MSAVEESDSASAPAVLGNREHQNIGDSVMYDVDPARWGRTFWSTFHLIAYAYPENPDEHTQEAVFRFFDSMRFLLPCSECRGGFRERWQLFDLHDHLATRSSLIEWVILVHDSVNEKLGVAPLDYAAFMQALLGENVVADDSDNELEASRNERETTHSDGAKNESVASRAQSSQKDGNRTTNRSKSHSPRNGAQQRNRRAHSSDSHQTALHKTRGRGIVNGAKNSPFEHAWRLQSEQERQKKLKPKQNRLESYHKARFAMQTRAQTMRYQSKNVAARVQAPRECENCNRKTFVPSIFS